MKNCNMHMLVNDKHTDQLEPSPGSQVYIYKHVDHASCSSVLLSQIHLCLTTHEQPEEVAKCSTPEHNRLLPFFYSNKSLLKFYKESFMKGLLELKSDIDLLEKIENEGNLTVVHHLWSQWALLQAGKEMIGPNGSFMGSRQLFQTAK